MNTYKVSGDGGDNEPRRWWRRPAVIAAAAVLAALLLIMGGVLLGRGSATTAAPARSATPAPVPVSTSTSSTTASASPALTPSATASRSTSDACPVGLVNDVLPASAPADVVWHATSVAAVPVSKTWGPYRTTATGLPRCFSHSPTGAVVAAVNINTWLFSRQWRTVLATQVARTSGYSELQSALESQPPDGSAEIDTVAGFAVVAYTATAATVEVVERSPNGGEIGCPLSEQWSDGDWQLTPRPDGTLSAMPCPDVTTGTYIPWGPDE